MFKRLIKNRQIKFPFKSAKNEEKIVTQFYKNDQLKEDQTYVSTSHPKSMLRFYKVKQSKDETKDERTYRLRYEQVQLWNHNYWLKNNETFQEVLF